MAPLLIEIGKVYVVKIDDREVKMTGLRIAKVVGRAAGGDVLVRARQGGMRNRDGWSRHVRRISSVAVRREASAREAAINFVVDPVPAAAS
jgi:hypothetical protein